MEIKAGWRAMSRPDYIKCVAETYAGKEHLSWCGRHVKHEFHFENIDHLAYTLLTEGRLMGCKKCVAKIMKSLGMNDE